jgi:hypothetical protein
MRGENPEAASDVRPRPSAKTINRKDRKASNLRSISDKLEVQVHAARAAFGQLPYVRDEFDFFGSVTVSGQCSPFH